MYVVESLYIGMVQWVSCPAFGAFLVSGADESRLFSSCVQDRGRGRTRYSDKGAATGKDKDAEATMGGRYPR